VEQVEKIGGGRGGLSMTVSDDKGQVLTKAVPVEPDGVGDLHTRFPLLFIDPALVKSISSRPTRIREWRCTCGRCRIRRSSRYSRARDGCSS
jgi:hypothetical protein